MAETAANAPSDVNTAQPSVAWRHVTSLWISTARALDIGDPTSPAAVGMMGPSEVTVYAVNVALRLGKSQAPRLLVLLRGAPKLAERVAVSAFLGQSGRATTTIQLRSPTDDELPRTLPPVLVADSAESSPSAAPRSGSDGWSCRRDRDVDVDDLALDGHGHLAGPSLVTTPETALRAPSAGPRTPAGPRPRASPTPRCCPRATGREPVGCRGGGASHGSVPPTPRSSRRTPRGCGRAWTR